jgi:hypothetical protein
MLISYNIKRARFLRRPITKLITGDSPCKTAVHTVSRMRRSEKENAFYFPNGHSICVTNQPYSNTVLKSLYTRTPDDDSDGVETCSEK